MSGSKSPIDAAADGTDHGSGTTVVVGDLTVFVRHDETAGRGRFSAWIDGHQTAELDYVVPAGAPEVWEFVHTYAEPAMRGTGVADALVGQAMSAARAAGLGIVPSCPYIPVWLSRHPECGDLVRGRS